MSKEQEIKERVEKLPPEHRKLLADTIDVLSQCFEKEGGMALVVFVPPESPIAQLFVLNASDVEAYDMTNFAREHIESLIVKDMPPKEMLN